MLPGGVFILLAQLAFLITLVSGAGSECSEKYSNYLCWKVHALPRWC